MNRPAEYSENRISLIFVIYEMYSVILKGWEDGQAHGRQCKGSVFDNK